MDQGQGASASRITVQIWPKPLIWLGIDAKEVQKPMGFYRMPDSRSFFDHRCRSFRRAGHRLQIPAPR
jgi:hypothetical protein